jgi:diaminopimelate epimerase
MNLSGLRLRKHHGLGNDFLVLVDLEDQWRVDAATARQICDRHTGVGADGLIRLGPPPRLAAHDQAGDAAVVGTMELFNADGSLAETSGNGLRCLGQAIVMEKVVGGPEVWVATAAGPRRLLVAEPDGDGVCLVSVGMGVPRIEAVAAAAYAAEPGARARYVDMGNPHLVVLVADAGSVDLGVVGPTIEARHPGGINVEFANLHGPDRVRVRTWERGAGETLACGSGSCATAAALRGWGLVGDRVVLENPGGQLSVDLSGDEAVLTGPAQFVAMVELA